MHLDVLNTHVKNEFLSASVGIKSLKVGPLGGSVKRWTLDIGSDHDLTVCEIESRVQPCADSAEPARDSLSPPLPLPNLLVHTLSPSQNK